MPRKIRDRETFDDIEDEILFTQAALEADPDASDLLPATESWLPLLDAARASDRAARAAAVQASAHRGVANGRLDDACRRFGRELALEASPDSARWRRYFPKAVSVWVSQRLAGQVAAVRGWLTIGDDALLDRHREPLTRWSDAAQSALDRTAASAQVRGTSRVGREELALDLTRERDGLEAALVERANARGLAREWPSRFFRASTRPSPAPEDAGSPS